MCLKKRKKTNVLEIIRTRWRFLISLIDHRSCVRQYQSLLREWFIMKIHWRHLLNVGAMILFLVQVYFVSAIASHDSTPFPEAKLSNGAVVTMLIQQLLLVGVVISVRFWHKHCLSTDLHPKIDIVWEMLIVPMYIITTTGQCYLIEKYVDDIKYMTYKAMQSDRIMKSQVEQTNMPPDDVYKQIVDLRNNYVSMVLCLTFILTIKALHSFCTYYRYDQQYQHPQQQQQQQQQIVQRDKRKQRQHEPLRFPVMGPFIPVESMFSKV